MGIGIRLNKPSFIDTLADKATGAIDAVKDKASDVSSTVTGKVGDFAGHVTSQAGDVFETVKDKALDLPETVADRVTNTPGKLLQGGRNLAQYAKEGSILGHIQVEDGALHIGLKPGQHVNGLGKALDKGMDVIGDTHRTILKKTGDAVQNAVQYTREGSIPGHIQYKDGALNIGLKPGQHVNGLGKTLDKGVSVIKDVNLKVLDTTAGAVKDAITNNSDGRDSDGRFSAREAGKNFVQGLVSPVTDMVSDPKKLAIGAGLIAGGVALTVATGGAALPFLVAAGVAVGGAYTGKAAYDIAQPKMPTLGSKPFIVWEQA